MPTRRRPSRLTASSVVESTESRHDTSRWRRRLTLVLIAMTSASLSVLAIRLFQEPVEPPQESRSLLRNRLVTTQQLDELYNVLRHHAVNASDLTSPGHVTNSLLGEFYQYDLRFVALNRGRADTRTATAYAMQRLGQSAQLMNDTQTAVHHYRECRDVFASIESDAPMSPGLFHDYLWTQMTIASLENELGRSDAAANELQRAVRMLESSRVPQFEESDDWLYTLYMDLALLGTKLRLYDDAIVMAKRYHQTISKLAAQDPENPELTVAIDEVERLLSLLHQALPTSAKS